MSRPVSFPLVAAAVYAVAAATAFVPILSDSDLTLCPFRLLTGLPCPGCGMGRALTAAFRGNLSASWHFHPLGLPLLILWTAWLVWGAFNLVRGKTFSDGFLLSFRRPAAAWGALALVLGVYAVRVA